MKGCDPCPLDGTYPADPAACDAFSQNLFCSELNPAGTGASAATWESFLQAVNCAGNPYVIPDPAVLACRRPLSSTCPLPTIDRSPDATLRYDGYAYSLYQLGDLVLDLAGQLGGTEPDRHGDERGGDSNGDRDRGPDRTGLRAG